MKKTFKALAVCAVAGTLCAGVAAFAGCGDAETKGEAYGLVHGAGYIGYASITVKGDKITDATLSEVCLPTYVVAGENVPDADKVTDTVISHGNEVTKVFYKTVSYGDVTLTYEAGKGYMNGTTSFADMMKDEAKAKAYYDAVMSNSVSVTIGSDKKTDILNKAALSKDENGYWTRKDKDGNDYSRWKMNRDATVNYVKEHGVANLTQLVMSEEKAPDVKEDKEVNYWMDGTINTGATWSDFYKANASGYLTYAQLFINAHAAATK